MSEPLRLSRRAHYKDAERIGVDGNCPLDRRLSHIAGEVRPRTSTRPARSCSDS